MQELDLSTEDVTFRLDREGLTVGEGEAVSTIPWSFIGKRVLNKVQDGTIDARRISTLYLKVASLVAEFRHTEERGTEPTTPEPATPKRYVTDDVHLNRVDQIFRVPLFADEDEGDD